MNNLTVQLLKAYPGSRKEIEGASLALLILLNYVPAQVMLATSPTTSVYLNALAFVVLVLIALSGGKGRPLTLSAALLPLASLVSFSLPQHTAFAQASVLYGALLVLGLTYRWIFGREWSPATSRVNWQSLAIPAAILSGAVLGLLGFGLMRHEYAFSGTALPVVAIASVGFAVAETVLFQGLIQRYASVLVRPVLAVVLATGLYFVTSIGAGSVAGSLFALISGGLMAFFYARVPNLLPVTILNVVAKLTYLGLLAHYVL